MRAIVLITVLFGAVLDVQAQGAIARRRAEQLHVEAGEAAADGRFAEARDLLRDALQLYPNGNTAQNLVEILRRMGEPTDAKIVLGRMLAGELGELSRQRRQAVRQLLRAVNADLAVIVIRLPRRPEGLEVRVDGARTALEGEVIRVEVDPGEHVVTAIAPLHHAFEQAVNVERGEEHTLQAELELTPEARVGTLILDADDVSHIVGVEGEGQEPGHLELRLAPGEYEVFVSDGRRRRTRSATVQGGATLRMDLSIGSRRRPWLWVGLASIVVVGAASVGTYFAVSRDSFDPIRDEHYGAIQTLTLAR